jgi:hypothetical protein
MIDFDPNDETNDSIAVPEDLMTVVRSFHDIRMNVRHRMIEAQEAFQSAQVRYQRQATALNAELDAAIVAIRDTLLKAGLAKEDEPLFLDTSRLVKHGHAYIVKPGNPNAPKSHTVH